MIERRAKVLISSVRKLARRGAWKNIQRILKKAHTADVASLIGGLEPDERLSIFRQIPDMETKAGVLSYLGEDVQTELMLGLERKEANKIVENMHTDDAADLLGHLPDDVSKEILASIEQESSEEVADLMRYPEDSAGGLMSSDYLALDEESTVGDAVREIQAQEEDSLVLFYVYVVSESGRLVGVLSLKNLILSRPGVQLKEVMMTDIIAATTEMTQAEVAQLVEKYDFLSVPVVDGSNTLVGVITVDDVIDVIREEQREDLLAMGRAGGGSEGTAYEHLRARLPWLFLSFAGGLVCFQIIDWTVQLESRDTLWTLAAFIPLLLSIGSTVGQQSGTVTVGAAREENLTLSALRAHILNETRIAFVLALLFGVLTWGLLIWPFGVSIKFSAMVALSLALQILISTILGNVVPMMIRKLGPDPTVVSIPTLIMFSDISSVVLLFSLTSSFALS